MGKYAEKINASPNQKKIKKALEVIGHTNVEVWWDKLEPAVEMCGIGGGYMFSSDQEEIYSIGYSFNRAMEFISNADYLRVIEISEA